MRARLLILLVAGQFAAGAASGVAAQAVRRSPAPDLVLLGGKVFTADSTRLWATAIAIRGERIVAVGSDAEISSLAGPTTRRVLLDGRTVVPGFNDAHAHVGAGIGGVAFKTSPSPTPDPSIALVLDSLAAVVRRTPRGTWITTAIAERVLGDSKARRDVLDRIAPFNPVMLQGWSGHGAVLNSTALRAMGLERATDPVGGWLERDSSGRATGRIDEYALYGALFRAAVARGPVPTLQAFAAYDQESSSFGITSLQNMATSLTPALAAAVDRAKVLGARHHVIPFEMTTAHRRDTAWNAILRLTSRTQVAGRKWVLDGTPIERLALMREPYADRAGWHGRANFPPDTLVAMLREDIARNRQPILHAVGDSSIALAFSAMRAVAPDSVWRRLRPRIEHGDNLMPDQFDAARQLGVVVVQNPAHFALEFRGTRWNDARASHSEAVRDILAAGIPVAIGSDGPANPGLNIMFAVLNPSNPPQALTREQAVIAYTRTAAWAEHAERNKGTLAAGMFADLAVLSQDIFTVPPQALPGTTSVLTLVGGRVTHDATAGAKPRGP